MFHVVLVHRAVEPPFPEFRHPRVLGRVGWLQLGVVRPEVVDRGRIEFDGDAPSCRCLQVLHNVQAVAPAITGTNRYNTKMADEAGGMLA